MTDDLTTPDRADRARLAWGLYRDLYGEEIRFLIADLMHLADVDEHPGGGAEAARQAVGDYVAEQPTWPAERTVPVYLAQFRPAGKDWITAATGDETTEPTDVAGALWHLMEKADFRHSEIVMHVQDLANGAVLTADNGTAFRLIENPEYLG